MADFENIQYFCICITWMYLCSCVKQDIEQFRCRTLYFNCYLDRILLLSNWICPKARAQTIQNKYCIILNCYKWTSDCIHRCMQCLCILFRLKLKELIISLPHQYLLVVQVRLKTPTQILNKTHQTAIK
jgi:hypothetical protein